MKNYQRRRWLSLVLVVGAGVLLAPKTLADSVTTSVTVGNSPPGITAGPAESTESSTANPTNVGTDVTFTVTATDSNSEDYYIAVCTTDAVTATNGGAPTCDVGTWCVSSSPTNSGSQASCARTTLVGDAVSNDWYVFVCDGNSSAASCSVTGDIGSGVTGSPFVVNHAPAFTVYGENGPKNPGQDVTFSSTASDSTDSDNVKLIVCKTAGISAGDCDGGASDRWCVSSLGASDPSCAYSLPTPTPDTSYDAYGYIVDEHNFGAGGQQGTNDAYVVNNIAPVVSAVSINAGAAMDMTEGTTTGIVLGATITDNNSCYGGELATIYGYAYRSAITYTGCDSVGEADNNNCYPEVSCSVVGGTCTDATDASANYTCTVNMQYYADPTDTGTEYPGTKWLDTIKAIDDDAASHNLEVTTGVTMNSLTALDVTSTINFSSGGPLDVGEKNDPLDKTTTVTPTGNVGLDTELSGAANMCTDYDTCSGGTPIGVAYIHYALAGSTAYGSGAVLTTSAYEEELNVPKDRTGSPTTKDIWWGIEIPDGTLPGAYAGANTVGAYKGETGGW